MCGISNFTEAAALKSHGFLIRVCHTGKAKQMASVLRAGYRTASCVGLHQKSFAYGSLGYHLK